MLLLHCFCLMLHRLPALYMVHCITKPGHITVKEDFSAQVPLYTTILLSLCAQVYVGELVEAACQAQDHAQEEGPLQPKHIREAVRRLKNNNKIPNTKSKKVFTTR